MLNPQGQTRLRRIPRSRTLANVESETIKVALRDISAEKDPTLKNLKLASLCTHLWAEQGVDLVIVGGSAIEILTEGAYVSGDLDLCHATGATLPLRLRQEIMGRLGAKGGPRNWQVAGTFLDLASYSNPDTVLTGGSAWGAYANGAANAFIDISRAFNTDGSSASLNNQTFSVAFNSSGIGGTGQSIGLGVGTAFSLGYAGGGADNMTLSVDGGAANPVSVNYAQMAAGINVALTVTGPLNSATEGYSLVISPFAGGPALYTGTGTFDSSAYDTSSFMLAVNNTANNQYFNNLSISAVPEPTSMVMLGFAGLTTLLTIRRRK